MALLDTEPTHRQAWTDVLGRYGMRFDLQAMIALNGSPPGVLRRP
jgi:beta-phosphoglucomutase-like phosphatase (HAD superfamily)